MISQFSVSNFRSYKDEVTLFLEASGSKSTGETDLIKLNDNKYLLPSVGIFGANASGKTNLLRALDFMVAAMHNDQPIQQPPSQHPILQPHILDQACVEQPAGFQIVLCDRNKDDDLREYIYGFEINKHYIVSEQLAVREKVKSNIATKTVFKRQQRNGRDKFQFHFSYKSSLSHLTSRVAPEGLAITTFAIFGDSTAKQVLNLVNVSTSNNKAARFYSCVAADHQDTHRLARDLYFQNPSIQQKVHKSMILADFGIKGVQTTPQGSISTRRRQYRQGAESGDIFFDLSDESWGTQKFFILNTIVQDALRTGGMLLLDDLGSVTHPLLTAEIMKQFNDKELNPNGAQLIYSSHEDYLLNPAVGLRKDQIYFAEKTRQGATLLQSLAEYKIRNDLDFGSHYLLGRFGALPQIKFNEMTADWDDGGEV